MKFNVKTSIALVALALAAYAAYAENITISTYYPSPYGSFQNLDISGNLLVGTTTAPPAGVKLDVQGGSVRSANTVGGGAAYMVGTNTEAFYGALIDGRPVWVGNVERLNTLVVDDGDLTVNGNARITGNATVVNALTLSDTAGGTINTGVLQTICDAANRCYAVAVYS